MTKVLLLVGAVVSAATLACEAGDAGRAPGISVVRQGFSQREVELPDGRTGHLGSYGVILFNPSRLHARAVDVAVTGFASSGRSVADDNLSLIVMPPQTRYYVGGNWATDARVSRLRTRVKVGTWIALGQRLPAVSGVRVTWPAGGDPMIRGTVLNRHADFSLSPDALVSAVLVAKDGRIVGGANSLLSKAPRPGARATFELRAYGARSTLPVEALVSVERKLTPYR